MIAEAAQPVLSSWQYIIVLAVGSIAGILGGVAAIISARRAKDVKEHLTTKEIEEKKWRDSTIGQVNGHGNLMRQMTLTMENVGTLTNHAYELNSKLDAHIIDSNSYRANMSKKLGEIKEEMKGNKTDLQNLKGELEEHISWEREMKYNQDNPEIIKENPE